MFTYEQIENLLKETGGEAGDPPDVNALKDALFDKLIQKALWTMRRENAQQAQDISFQIDVSFVAGAVSELEGSGGTLEITLGCCNVDGCGGCEPFNVTLP